MCENLSNGQKNEYWKMLRKLEDLKDNMTYTKNQQLVKYFLTILCNPNLPDKNVLRQERSAKTSGNLDDDIFNEELDAASKIHWTG